MTPAEELINELRLKHPEITDADWRQGFKRNMMGSPVVPPNVERQYERPILKEE